MRLILMRYTDLYPSVCIKREGEFFVAVLAVIVVAVEQFQCGSRFNFIIGVTSHINNLQCVRTFIYSAGA